MADKEIEEMSFEEAMEELEKIVQTLEDEKLPVERATELYERGTKMKEYCQEILNKERVRIEKIAEENGIDLGEIEKEVEEDIE